MNGAGALTVAGRTHAGQVRTQNEDYIGYDTRIGAVVLADGMGGYRGGEIASAIAVNTILDHLRQTLPGARPGEIDPETGVTRQALAAREAIIRANDSIYKTSRSQAQYQGMGTTVVLAIFHGNRVTIGHVGDSRIYRLRDNELDQVTIDHTLLQELVDRGFYTPGEAKASLNKNLVTRALGIEPTVAVDIIEDVVFPDDVFLLCSDGLNDMVDDEDIRLVLRSYEDDLEKAADELINLANEAGGRDNISAILVKATGVPEQPSRSWVRRLASWFN
jgi:protein phosphatase